MNAIGYTRISTEDQSYHSIDGQRDVIASFCERSGYNLIETFVDEGQSAKNFDRANWRALEQFIAKNKNLVQYLIVMKYDRFSRNLPDALAMISKLENKFNIKILSANEPIGLPPESPFFFQLRTQLLLNAHVELLVIKERTQFGVYNKAKKGLMLKAPYGYRLNKQNPATIVEDEADIVRFIFRTFASGLSITETGRVAREKGFARGGNSAIKRILELQTYIGDVRVPAFKDQNEHWIKGAHEPIVANDLFWKVQLLLNPEKAKRIEHNDEVYMKGAIKCECGETLTSSKSKGKSKHYWYYVCPTERTHYSALEAHGVFEQILSYMTLPLKFIHHFMKRADAMFEERRKSDKSEIKSLKKELLAINQKIESLEEKYISNSIEADTYKSWKLKLVQQRTDVLAHLDQYNFKEKDIFLKYKEELKLITNISNLFKASNIRQKLMFIKVVFDENLYYSKGTYRTPYISPLFSSQLAPAEALGLIEIKRGFAVLEANPRMYHVRESNP